MAKKKKLSVKEKAIRRITRRLKTLERNDVGLKRSATRRTAERLWKANKDKIDADDLNSVNDFVNSAVNATKYFDRRSDTAKEFKKASGHTYKELEKMGGQEVADAIADALENGMSREDVAKAFGYSEL